MFYGELEEEARRLHDQALAHIRRNELTEAREIATALRTMRWSGAFEILALVARAEGDLEGATRALEEGLEKAPSAWLLHQLYGTIRDERGQHEDAVLSFDAALRCEGAWVSSIRFNRAVSYMRAGFPGDALADAEAVLEDPATPPFTLDALRIAIDALSALGRSNDAISLVEHMKASLTRDDESGRAELAAFMALAGIRAELGDDKVRACLDEAIEGGAHRRELLDALLAMPHSEDTADTKFRITISVPMASGGPEGAIGYLRVLEIHAASDTEAFELARSLEPRALREKITIEESRVLAKERAPARVLSASGRIYFGE
jgi:tetratricopeptide (TPR) repeat protein